MPELALSLLIPIQLVSCGTILYPERRDQRSGQVDVAVVLMDAIGFFFFTIPGVIAFAVDFSTGAIYLPPSKAHSKRYSQRQESATERISHSLRIDPRNLTPETITRALAEETGYQIRLDDPSLIVIRADAHRDIDRELAKWMAAPGKTSRPPSAG